MAHIIDQHKVRRNALLFIKMVRAAADKTFIFANDAKGGRVDTVGDPKIGVEIIETALRKLLEHENKNTVVIPGVV